ncbi:Maf family protein [Marinomonas foliarum]|uniref:7-methyl-GTP pyrophosphatase n=1 Tax=Marinomonas foliarum TaxID=491950 RepID=A0A369A261_9GAMM|nr:nucleoside triphosphate pyrophosphatase [Marinomonas foliarum]QRV23978.1 septum formation inhibitor Maf [Marinomonas foliarum]RCX02446.1 MAF protein [Marinomonas foliarum]
MLKKIILGSSSPYRKELLQRLNLHFECHSPNIDESRLAQESAQNLVQRLTLSKAKAVHEERLALDSTENALIITSDQIAVLNSTVLGKPHTEANAIKQLTSFSGQKVSFLTGLCLFDQENKTYQYELNEFHVYFRHLTHQEISRYVAIEQPLDCAGSFKCEGLGVCLFEKMEGNDPTSLIGLPLIMLSSFLRKAGVNPIS